MFIYLKGLTHYYISVQTTYELGEPYTRCFHSWTFQVLPYACLVMLSWGHIPSEYEYTPSVILWKDQLTGHYVSSTIFHRYTKEIRGHFCTWGHHRYTTGIMIQHRLQYKRPRGTGRRRRAPWRQVVIWSRVVMMQFKLVSILGASAL